MSDNSSNNSVLWFLVILISIYIVVKVLPEIKIYPNGYTPEVEKATQTEVVDETQDEDTNIFSTIDIKNSTVTIKSYTDGVVFQEDGNYTIDVLKDDMGYILTPTNESGIPIGNPHMFIGKGWFTLNNSPIEMQEEDINTKEVLDIASP